MAMDLTQRPVWADIYLNRIQNNIVKIREHIGPKPQIMAVVKADGYGHGAVESAIACVQGGATRLAVSLIEEGVELKQAGLDVPIQALAGFVPRQVELAIKNDIILAVGSKELAVAVNNKALLLGKKALIHLKVDTGMGRYGPQLMDAVPFIKWACEAKGLEVEGIFSHFACSDQKDKDYTIQQFNAFQALINELEEKNIDIPLKHIANSGATIDLKTTAFDIVRPGIMIYGLYPSDEVEQSIALEPALEWKAQIVQIKKMAPHSGLSYHRTYNTGDSWRKIALLPLGYADGLSRSLTNKGEVLVRGQKAPIRGIVCMDQCLIDVTDIDEVTLFDEAVLIGKQGQEKLTVEEMANLCGTINYETLCMISKRVPRFYHY